MFQRQNWQATVFVCVSLCSHFGIAQADTQLEYRQIPASAAGENMSIAIANGRTAMKSSSGMMLHKVGSNDLTMVDHQRKSYTVMDEKTASGIAGQRDAMQEKMAQAMQQMRSQLASLAPEQRAMMEEMMKGKMAGLQAAQPGSSAPYSFKRIAVATVGEWKCDRYQALQAKQVKQEFCVVAADELGISANDFETLTSALTAMSLMAKRMGGSPMNMGDLQQLNGIPVQVKDLVSGQLSVLEKVSTTAIAPSAVMVPAGYQEMKMPTMATPQ